MNSKVEEIMQEVGRIEPVRLVDELLKRWKWIVDRKELNDYLYKAAKKNEFSRPSDGIYHLMEIQDPI